MKKFTLMILGISVFFTGLGGIVKHINHYFTGGDRVITFVRTSDEKVRLSENFEKPKQLLIINNLKEQKHEFNIKMPSPLPKQPEKSLEFERLPSRVPLPEGIELPRVYEQDDFIQRQESEETQNPEQAKTSQIRVFVDKEKITR